MGFRRFSCQYKWLKDKDKADIRKLTEEFSAKNKMSMLLIQYEFEYPDSWQLGRIQKNPVFAMSAYETARQSELDIPTWVLVYFDDLAAGRASLPTNRDKKNAETFIRNAHIAAEAHDLRNKTKRGWASIQTELANKYEVSEEVVKSCRKKLIKFLDCDGT